MDGWKDFSGPNTAYLLELYERYRQDPGSVDPAARDFFAANPPPIEVEAARTGIVPATPAPAATAGGYSLEKATAALNLAQAIRWYGHWAADLDPLGSHLSGEPALRLETYGLSEADLRALPASLVGGAAGEQVAARGGSAWEAIQSLREIYSGTAGFDYLQIRSPQERAWLREAAETRRFHPANVPFDGPALLDRLTEVEVFEHFLQRSFPGKTRFSIEGLDMLVPLLDFVIGAAAQAGIGSVLIGMAHRGRLNVLAHILNKPIDQILAEFKDPLARRVLQNEPTGWAGDVKYHAGAQRVIDRANGSTPDAIELTVLMAPNPSHLEAVNPVIEGMARAAGTSGSQPGPATFDPRVTLPVVIHGDAAFPGEGVVAETLNFYRLRGFETGGTIHVIANNQLGFTTDPGESRSTLFASDLAKGYRIPVIHANADDPQAVIEAARTAFAYRQHFQNDFLIDLIGYRRLGHNEGDEPAFTQPVMYQRIESHPTVRALWAARLAQAGSIPAELPDQLYQQKMDALQQALDQLDPDVLREPIPPPPPAGAARKVRTAVPEADLRALDEALLRLPDGFSLHPRLARIRQRREKMLREDPGWPSIDWSAAEELALASILAAGTPIRFTGQDAERGTFSHRHAVLHDAQTGERYTPLQALPQARAAFDIYNSPLSEFAALAFEFGYNVRAPGQLVIWEAQYGDFINNAQTVVDEFIATSRDKWGQLPSLVMLLPHGYEGQGPDHSSGRLERFLNLAVDQNLRVANCTTAANYFHLLRRQAALLAIDPLPLVVMTPKSLLRHPLVASPLTAFTEGGWQPVIAPMLPRKDGSTPAQPDPATITRLALCSGKIYVDLVTSEIQPQHPELGIARLEQLAPFPMPELQALLERYPALEEVLWVQEEPLNMGGWDYLRPRLEQAVEGRAALRVVARPPSASTAEGSNNLHTYNQKKLVEQVFNGQVRARAAAPRKKKVQPHA